MKMKPFDMQAALSGAPVVTRDGRRVRNFQYVIYPINATIENSDGADLSAIFTKDGRYFDGKTVSPRDLFMLDEEGGEE